LAIDRVRQQIGGSVTNARIVTSVGFEWKLSVQQDGFGFYYGEARGADRKVCLEVLPPASLWDGAIRAFEPDTHAWIVFLDGTEVARVENEQELPMVGQQVLLNKSPARQSVLEKVRSGALRLIGRY